MLRGLGAVAGLSAVAGYTSLAPPGWPGSLHDPDGERGKPVVPTLTLPEGGFAVAPLASAADVGVARGSSIGPMVRAAIDEIGGIARFIDKGDVVVLKPNVAFDRAPPLGATSNPEVVAALVEVLVERTSRASRIPMEPPSLGTAPAEGFDWIETPKSENSHPRRYRRSTRMKKLLLITLLPILGGVSQAQENTSGIEEVRQRFDAFNEAWRVRDMEFIRDFFAHDEEMLLFFERRQLRGWKRVETLYENMFAHALPGSVELTYSNLDIRAQGGLAFVAANFHLQVDNPQGETMTDTGRMTVVFEERDGTWVVVHRHTSFQAPAGPQRKVAIHTEPGPLWSPTLEGAWKSDDGATLVATASYVSASGLAGFPPSAQYRLDEDGLWLSAAESGATPTQLEVETLTVSELVLRLPEGSRTFRRVE